MKKKSVFWGLSLLAVFIGWTVAVRTVDVQAIGPMESTVGFATLNRLVHERIGVHWGLYHITDWLGLVPLAVVLGFGVLGLCQWLRRKALGKVDRSILVLGGFYVLVLAMFVLFEYMAINDRPVLIDGVLEASYPSSTTMLVLCVMPTAAMQLRIRIKNRKLRGCMRGIILCFTGFMVVGRLLAGVHWISDIVGGGLLSAGLVMLYDGFACHEASNCCASLKV